MGGTIHMRQGRWLFIVYRLDKRSRMNREIHVRNCGSVGVKFPCATRPDQGGVMGAPCTVEKSESDFSLHQRFGPGNNAPGNRRDSSPVCRSRAGSRSVEHAGRSGYQQIGIAQNSSRTFLITLSKWGRRRHDECCDGTIGMPIPDYSGGYGRYL